MLRTARNSDMNVTRGGLLLLGFITACHVIGLLLFCKGFLLKRVVIAQYSACTNPNGNQTARSHGQGEHHFGSCNAYPRKFKRVVWLLMDALRYDFTLFDEHIPDPVPVYRNKLPFIRDLLRDEPRNAKLFRCVADPPTTTMQRLKAITTGSLPTFVDISSNFNSHEILEDSLPYQARANGRNVTFMGDDTWLGLYPQMLTKVFDYPSLNVKDLDTVDNGVMAHMVPELEAYDAEFVIGHFLGVDHVGHIYGPSHSTMAEKLSQMNEVLKSVLAVVDEDTLVFMFGDHGMTETGDHGGETELETDSALLVYTPRPIFDAKQPSGRAVSQIDLVPSVALALGLPIPFSSLGLAIPEVFLPFDDTQSPAEDHPAAHSDGYSGRVTQEYLTALRTNTHQIAKYLETYIRYSDDFPSDVYHQLKEKLAAAHKLHDAIVSDGETRGAQDRQAVLSRAASAYVDYIRSVKAMCQRVWAKFDDQSIFKGLAIVLLSTSLTPLALLNVSLAIRSLHRAVTIGCSIGTVVGVALIVLHSPQLDLSPNGLISLVTPLTFSSLLLSCLLYLGGMRQEVIVRVSGLLTSQKDLITLLYTVPFIWVVAMVTVVLYGVSMLSNSFILYEGDVVAFFLQSLLVCFMIRRLKPMVCGKDKPHSKHFSTVCYTVLTFGVLMACVRVTKLFHTCRDLQVGCEATTFTMAASSVAENLGTLLKWRLLTSCACVCFPPVALAMFVGKHKDSRCLSGSLLNAVRYGLPAASLCVCGLWMIQSLPQGTLDRMPFWQHILLPRAVLAICAMTVAVVVLCPFKPNQSRTLVIYEGEDQRTENTEHTQTESTTPATKRRSATSPLAHEDSAKKPHAVSRTAPTLIPLLVLVVSVWLPVAMVINDAMALSATVMVVQVASFILALERSEDGTSFPVIVAWGLMSCQFFFGLGHHATITSLRFEAAFVALHGDITWYNLPIAATLVGLNMLASQVLFGIGLPLTLLLVGTKASLRFPITSMRLLVAGLQYITFHSAKLVVSVVAASLHRRHLMIWGVFSPRFLYEAGFQVTTDVSIILVFLLLRRLEKHSPL